MWPSTATVRAPAGTLDEGRQSALDRGGIRVVGVVHEHAACAPLLLLTTQWRELDRRGAGGQAVDRQAGADVRGGGGGQVRGMMGRSQRHDQFGVFTEYVEHSARAGRARPPS